MPYLKSEYGKEFDYDAPVKLLDAMMHEQAQDADQQVPAPGRQPCFPPSSEGFRGLNPKNPE